LIRSTGVRPFEAIEPYHDRIRDAVLANVDVPSQCAYHQRLAQALEASEAPDPEMLAVHWRAAGDITRAARHALAAAERAEAALDFARAARLYEAALEAHAPGALERRPLEAKLARALANAGRGKQAAAHYLAAADDQPESIELRRRAAEHLLRSG